ncbi:hypothetical protein [Fischerella sp. JS2]|nr:hypothetical protein [Fischerella sp. JS2]
MKLDSVPEGTSIAAEGTEFAIAIPLRQSVFSSYLPFNISLSS